MKTIITHGVCNMGNDPIKCPKFCDVEILVAALNKCHICNLVPDVLRGVSLNMAIRSTVFASDISDRKGASGAEERALGLR